MSQFTSVVLKDKNGGLIVFIFSILKGDGVWICNFKKLGWLEKLMTTMEKQHITRLGTS